MADIKKKAGHTMRIFGSDMPVVGEDEKTMVDARPRLTDLVSQEVAPATPTDGVGLEVILVQDRVATRAAERTTWRAIEVWTRNRIYGLDAALVCFEVIERNTGIKELKNHLLGFRLGGGRLREGGAARFSFPFPVVGMDAMFTDGKKHAYTSRVERLVARVRELRTRLEDEMPAWEDITMSSRHGLPKK